MYYHYMLLSFVANGFGIFGLRILAGAGLGEVGNLQYLSLWYLAGLLVAAIIYLWRHRRPTGREVMIAGGMALCSLCGQLGMALALSSGIPGLVVYPVATGGGVLLVVLVGVLSFRDRIRSVGYLGLATGTLALVLLALP